MMTDLTHWRVRGPVRSIRQEFVEWKGKWEAPRGFSAFTFRPDGRVSENEIHNPDGSVVRWTRSFDGAGRVIEERCSSDCGPGRTTQHVYDGEGRLTATFHVAPDGTRTRVETFIYDADGRQTKMADLSADLSVQCHRGDGTMVCYGAPGAVRATTSYDGRGLPADVSFHDPNGALVRQVVFTRDDEGRVLTEAVFFGGGLPFPDVAPDMPNVSADERRQAESLMTIAFADQIFSITTYAYDRWGRLQERTDRIGTLSDERTTYEYDDCDNPISDVTVHHNRELHADDDGSTRTTEHEPRTTRHRYEYQYDAGGNWTERIVSTQIGDAPEFRHASIERRAIAYYDGP